VPAFVQTAAGRSFYRVQDGKLQYLLADGHHTNLERPPGVSRFSEIRRTIKPVFENEVASYFPVAGELGLVEFHSKANTLDGDSMKLIEEAVGHASSNYRALLIHNDAQHFSCGVNLQGVLDLIVREDFDGIDRFLDHFQQTCRSLRMAPIPVVAAPSGLSLGGGFEVVLHTDKAIYHANSVSGLVESLVGVVPGGGGVKEMVYRWSEKLGDSAKGAWQAFMNVGYGKTARSPLEAKELCLFREGTDDYLMNRDRLLDAAIAAAGDLAPGYSPSGLDPIAAAGRDACTEMIEWLRKAQAKGRLTPHDVTTGSKIAMIVTGGDVDGGEMISEQDFFDLERKAFVALCQTNETRARIEHMLKYGSPLRN
jgi:3-hydroxyacyl-CoA dehydrogenase